MVRDEVSKKRIKKALQEISDSMTRTESERDLIKEIVKDVCEEFQINKKTFRRMAKTYHKRNFSVEVALDQEFETMYETITNETTLSEYVGNGVEEGKDGSLLHIRV